MSSEEASPTETTINQPGLGDTGTTESDPPCRFHLFAAAMAKQHRILTPCLITAVRKQSSVCGWPESFSQSFILTPLTVKIQNIGTPAIIILKLDNTVLPESCPKNAAGMANSVDPERLLILKLNNAVLPESNLSEEADGMANSVDAPEGAV